MTFGCLIRTVFLKEFCPAYRFHLRWGCREVLYDYTTEGETYVSGLVMTKVSRILSVDFDDTVVWVCEVFEQNMQ